MLVHKDGKLLKQILIIVGVFFAAGSWMEAGISLEEQEKVILNILKQNL
jgi:hypothetical protein